MRLIRENWKRDLLSKKKTTFTSKSDNDFYNELEERWKLGLLDDAGEEFETTIIVPNEEPLIKTRKTPKKNTAPLISIIFPYSIMNIFSSIYVSSSLLSIPLIFFSYLEKHKNISSHLLVEICSFPGSFGLISPIRDIKIQFHLWV